MTKDQQVHIGMLNSYNLMMGKTTIDDIIDARVAFFAHQPDEDIEFKNIEFIILYFQELEMFEHCADLKKYLIDNYDADGTPKLKDCDCEYPEITEYKEDMRCSRCDKRLRQ